MTTKIKEDNKYGKIIFNIPGLQNYTDAEVELLKKGCDHIKEDIKDMQNYGIKFPIGTEIKILSTIKEGL